MRIIVWSALAVSLAAAPPDGVEFFEKEVRPLLADKCYSCHSSKAPTRFAGLSFDTSLKSVVVPGQPSQSKIVLAVQGKLATPMPPGGRLSAQQIATLVRWVEMGAPWPEPAAPPSAPPQQFDLAKRKREHWAWQPVHRVAPPAVRDQAWPIEPTDRFLLARLEKEGLPPAPPASRRAWLRRLSFDLTGLPPAPDELAAFESDTRPDAHARQVDRLLDSPRFGEHWARHWMDLVRYAESHGSEGDPDTPHAWRYRDYVIRALNADVPYDQLVREHIAGDLLPRPRRDYKERVNESLLGSANLRMVEHGFQPVDPWEDRVKWVDNQIDVFAKTFQGLTISCARCHDHKFDAISQKDYYALFGTFAGARPTQSPVDLPEDLDRHRTRLESLKREIKAATAEGWKRAARELPSKLDLMEFRVEHEAQACDPASPLNAWWSVGAKRGEEFRAAWRALSDRWTKRAADARGHNANFKKVWDLRDGFAQWVSRGPTRASPAGEFWIAPPSGARSINAVYPRGVYTNLVSNKHGGVFASPRFKIDSDYVSVRMLGGSMAYAQIIIENYAVPRGGIYALRLVPGRDEMKWATFDTNFWRGFTAYVEFATFEDATHQMPMGLKKKMPTDGRSWIGAQQVWFHDDKAPPQEEWEPVMTLADGGSPESAEALARRYASVLEAAVDAWASGTITDHQAEFLNYFVKTGVLPDSAPEALVSEYRKLESEIPVARRAPAVLEEGGADQPLLVRGNLKNPAAPVPKRYLEALGGEAFTDARSARLRLADAVASPANPLTARVMVNRIWRHMFGTGLVRTVDNFGKLGEPPSNPELLDWLAARFVEQGWSIKKAVRTLAHSQAYRMASAEGSAARQADPANRLLSHMPVRRLEAEAIRDSMLWVSGQLKPAMYGPSVDTFYMHDTGKTKGDKPKGPLDGDGRRSVYLEVRRNVTNPFLEVFDTPKVSSTRGERDVTNVPAQSLAFMNSPFVIEQAAKWASTLTGSPGERVDAMFLRAVGRVPNATERDRALSLADSSAWRDLAQAIFNLKEFIYVR